MAREEQNATETLKNKKHIEAECDELKKNIGILDANLRKCEADKIAKENKLRFMGDENQKQEIIVNKLNRERKHQEELAKKLIEDLKIEEERNAMEKNLRQKLEQNFEVFVKLF